jgi:hypothetical protein
MLEAPGSNCAHLESSSVLILNQFITINLNKWRHFSKLLLLITKALTPYMTVGRQEGGQTVDWFHVTSKFRSYCFRDCSCAEYKKYYVFGCVCAPNIKILTFSEVFVR